MGKWNCCIPGCNNNWRNSPSLSFHRIPTDHNIRKQYDILIKNDNLKLLSASTRICGAHFPGGARSFTNQLPSLFPWTKKLATRRDIVKNDIYFHEQKCKRHTEDSDCHHNNCNVVEIGKEKNDESHGNPCITNPKSLRFLCIQNVGKVFQQNRRYVLSLREEI